MPWFVYMVRCRDGSLYTGITKDLDARVAAHSAGRGARYTRSRRPVTLVYSRRARDKSAALRAEHRLKRLTRAEKLALTGAPAGLARVRRRTTC
ncbi:MAG: GIY-YIG nuclease family protein [Myxococcaceae bacterium]|jgi:putative endonuclease|nr:GIY-YIG nuclease family protein [Myxococcaceae bacterium]